MNEQEETGQVKWFDARKGYGFIKRPNGNDIFVHYSSIVDEQVKSLNDGDTVTYVIGQGQKGPAAQNVKKVNE